MIRGSRVSTSNQNEGPDLSCSKHLAADKVVVDDARIAFCIVFYYCALITNHSFKHFFGIDNPMMRAGVSAAFMVAVGLVYIVNLSRVLKRISTFFLGTYLLMGVVFAFNYLLFPENAPYLLEVSFWLFLICIPLFLYYLALCDKAVLLDMLVKSAYYQIALAILVLFSTDLTTRVYDMVYSYLVLVPVTLLIYKMSSRFKAIDLVLTIAGVYSILAIGSRGPLLAAFVYAVVLFGRRVLELRPRSVIVFLVGVGIALIIIWNSDLALSFISSTLNKQGIDSRTLELLTQVGTVDFSTGRNYLYEITIDHIRQKPYFGYGLAGDRVFLNGTYPHNVFLEIVAQQGFILGLPSILVLLLGSLRPLLLPVDEAERDLSILFLAFGFVPHLVSGSYLTSGGFWVFVAVGLNSIVWRSIPYTRTKRSVTVS